MDGVRVLATLAVMSRVFITGSADGLGLMAARLLIADGHEVFLHARSRARGQEALLGASGAAGVLVGDLSSLRRTRELADSVNCCALEMSTQRRPFYPLHWTKRLRIL